MKEHDEIHDAPQEEFVEEMDFEPEEELSSIGAAQAKIKKIRGELKETQQKRDEYLAGWQREKADGVNLRRELTEDAKRAALRIKEGMVEELLPVLDSFDMAIGSDAWSSVGEGWQKGMEHVYNQLLEVLRRNGIERFGKVGEMFDPYVHEIVQETDDAPGQKHEIVRVLRYGYKAGDRVVRPAQVITKA